MLKHTNASLTEVDDKDFLVTNYAVASGNLELIDLLMAEDPDFPERSSSIVSPLFYTARQGYVDVLRHFIEKHGIKPSGALTPSTRDTRTRARTRPAAHALATAHAQHEHARTHASPHERSDRYDHCLSTPNQPIVRDSNDHSLLHTAAYSGKVEVMQFLIGKGYCLVDDRTTADITPVLWACDGVRLQLFNYFNFLLFCTFIIFILHT